MFSEVCLDTTFEADMIYFGWLQLILAFLIIFGGYYF